MTFFFSKARRGADSFIFVFAWISHVAVSLRGAPSSLRLRRRSRWDIHVDPVAKVVLKSSPDLTRRIQTCWLSTRICFCGVKSKPLHSGPMTFSSNQPLFIFWCAINTWTTVIPDFKNDGAHGVLKIINSLTHLKMSWIVSYACAGSCCAFLLGKFKIG